MGTIETSHRNIVNLLTIINEALAAISKIPVPLPAKYAVISQQIVVDAKEMRTRYHLGVSPYIAAYYMIEPAKLQPGASKHDEILREAYWDFVSSGNIIGSINSCMRRIDTVIGAIDDASSASAIAAIMTRRNNHTVEIELNRVKASFCDCGGQFIIYTESNERKCSACGSTSAIYESIIEDHAITSQETTGKTKQGRHHPHVHCKIWVGRIQAWDGPEVPDDIIRRLQDCCRRDRVNKKKIACARIRKYLKEINETDYNVCVPFIRKLLTGIAPPQLTPAELNSLYSIFDRMVTILKKLRPDNNITYYPHIIYKILDSILTIGNRKAQILDCIHLQSNKTTKLVDKIYEPIYKQIDELKAKPTNKHEYTMLL